MPRFTVHIRDEWLAVPCRDATNTIHWLGQEALKRYVKNKPDNGGIKAVKDTHFVVRRCQSLGLLDADDTIEDVLEDNDFVELGNDNMHVKYLEMCAWHLEKIGDVLQITVRNCAGMVMYIACNYH